MIFSYFFLLFFLSFSFLNIISVFLLFIIFSHSSSSSSLLLIRFTSFSLLSPFPLILPSSSTFNPPFLSVFLLSLFSSSLSLSLYSSLFFFHINLRPRYHKRESFSLSPLYSLFLSSPFSLFPYSSPSSFAQNPLPLLHSSLSTYPLISSSHILSLFFSLPSYFLLLSPPSVYSISSYHLLPPFPLILLFLHFRIHFPSSSIL